MMNFKCLLLDHDDTVVNSTATIHYPCFIKYLGERHPDLKDKYDLPTYFLKNFHPGVFDFFHEEVGMSLDEMKEEEVYWQDYVSKIIPQAYDGLREIMLEFLTRGGILAVASHSFKKYIERDYKANNLPIPSDIYGWDLPKGRRKPSPYAIEDLKGKYHLKGEEILVVDDLKPGCDMARSGGAKFACASWAYKVPEIETFMKSNCDYYLNTVEDLKKVLFD